jgi:hypothetical protein
MIARFDGQFIRGVARLSSLGRRDFLELIAPWEMATLDRFDTETVSWALASGPFVPLPGSALKNIFITINPRVRPHGPRARMVDREPMPIIF